MARIDDYRESFRLAAQELVKGDLPRIAEMSGADMAILEDGACRLRVLFFGSPYWVQVREGVEVIREGWNAEVSLPEKILLCHYLLHAHDEPVRDELITFRDIPDGHFYFEAFQRRARDPFLSTFGWNGKLYRACAGDLGGTPVENGDVGMSFRVLPRITIQIVLWEGDEELPPEATILFDTSIRRRLPAEDIVVLSGMLVYRLIGIAGSRRFEVSGPST